MKTLEELIVTYRACPNDDGTHGETEICAGCPLNRPVEVGAFEHLTFCALIMSLDNATISPMLQEMPQGLGGDKG